MSDDSDSDNDSIPEIPKKLLFIKWLPKDELLYELWLNANNAQYMYYCNHLAPTLTLKKATRDIKFMIEEKRELDMTTYYGRLIFSDISGDYLDAFTYDLYNGDGLAQKIVNRLKIKELKKIRLRYFLSM